MRKLSAALLVAVFLFSAVSLLCAQEKTPDEIVAIAVEAVKGQGVEVEDAKIIYDEGGQLWSREVGYMIEEDASPNHGILKRGFLKNYRIVMFDLEEPATDIWVFIDKDTGDVLEISR
ncbi:MAG: hypothetical protein WC301_02080 [Candidatus Omnitrophota bacterium]|jgi:hypothetical protein